MRQAKWLPRGNKSIWKSTNPCSGVRLALTFAPPRIGVICRAGSHLIGLPVNARAFVIRRPLRVAALLAAAALLATGCIGLEQRERELTFRPTRAEATWYSGLPSGVQEITLPVDARPDAPRISAWWWPDDDPHAPVVFYLHGARWNLTGHLNRIAQLREFGFSVFAIDYRGFGKSDGDLPSEALGLRGRARRLALGRRARARSGASLHLRAFARRRGGGRPRREPRQRRRRRARPDHRVVVHEFRRDGVGDHARPFPVGDADAEIRFDRQDRADPDAGPRRARRRRPLRAGPLQRSAVRGGARPKRLLVVPNGSHNNSLSIGGSDYRRCWSSSSGSAPPARWPVPGS